MADTLNHQSPLTRDQESLITVLVILLFGLIYWFFISGDHSFDESIAESRITTETDQTDTIDHLDSVINVDSGKRAALANQLEAETGSLQRSETTRLNAEENVRRLTARVTLDEMARQQMETDRLKAEGAARQLTTQLTAEQAARKETETARLKSEEESRQLTAQLAAEQTARKEAEEARLKSEAKAQKLVEDRWVVEKEAQRAEKERKQVEFSRMQFALPGGEAVTIQEGGMVDQFKRAILEHRVNQPLVFDRIFFNTGSVSLKGRASCQQVKEIAALLNTYGEIDVNLRGHTDNMGPPTINKALSFERSANLKKALVVLGIPEERIHNEGMGATQPIADNSTASGRRKNRRIEIIIVE